MHCVVYAFRRRSPTVNNTVLCQVMLSACFESPITGKKEKKKKKKRESCKRDGTASCSGCTPQTGIARWYERRTRDRKVAARDFSSPELTFCADSSYSVSVPPRVTALARKRPRSFCQKVQMAGYT